MAHKVTEPEDTIERTISKEELVVYGKMIKGYSMSDEDYREIESFTGKAVSEDGKEGTLKKDRFITFLASDETVDSYGDILRVDGCDLSRYKSGSAAFITSHNIGNIAGSCGVIVKAWKAKNVQGSPNGKAVMVTVYFPTFEEDPDADYVFKKYKAGTLKAVSVGLQVLEFYDPPRDSKERKDLGLGKWGIEVKRWAPYELSAVTVGANPNALKKSFTNEELRQLIDDAVSKTIEKMTQQKSETNGKEATPEPKLRFYLDDVKLDIQIKE